MPSYALGNARLSINGIELGHCNSMDVRYEEPRVEETADGHRVAVHGPQNYEVEVQMNINPNAIDMMFNQSGSYAPSQLGSHGFSIEEHQQIKDTCLMMLFQKMLCSDINANRLETYAMVGVCQRRVVLDWSCGPVSIYVDGTQISVDFIQEHMHRHSNNVDVLANGAPVGGFWPTNMPYQVTPYQEPIFVTKEVPKEQKRRLKVNRRRD